LNAYLSHVLAPVAEAGGLLLKGSKTTMKFITKTLLGVLGLISTQVMADDGNQFDYVGLSLQQSSYRNLDFSPTIKPNALTPLSYHESLSGSGFRGFIGHQFNQYLSLEAGVGTYGKADFKVTQEETGTDGKPVYKTVFNGGFKTTAGDLRVVGTYPLSDSLFLKAHLGALVWSNELTTLDGTVAQPETLKASDNGVSLLTGLGLGYGFNNKIAVALDFERVKIASIQTQNLNLSLIVRF
jgi:hypothetical protein